MKGMVNMNNLIIMRNQEVVGYYMAETGIGFRYAVLVKINYYDGAKYGFITTSGQVTKEYKTKRSMSKWAMEREWQEIKTTYHQAKCQEMIKSYK